VVVLLPALPGWIRCLANDDRGRSARLIQNEPKIAERIVTWTWAQNFHLFTWICAFEGGVSFISFWPTCWDAYGPPLVDMQRVISNFHGVWITLWTIGRLFCWKQGPRICTCDNTSSVKSCPRAVMRNYRVTKVEVWYAHSKTVL
jgi:hypothetical protein